ncbi:hypothetical protein HAP41_0000047845 (plasmid) [Bradyrhizobium barranii subsp. apii]|uniref:Uncharacterized protein n=1 Tax=Bradyrhizobium barranii subsp. apii TaxID=2819348 RepID=A0A8T5VQP9_9BRAD|nr:hypothetical protein [Bradyrhizobium barranii]UPT92273.1 hypothetical protein HAP41_0000047845 [Bradyrhizobium barranii subsp. apii]
MILDLHGQGLSVSAIARQPGLDQKTVRAYIAEGLEAPVYKKRAARPGIVDHFEAYLRERLAAYPALTTVRLSLSSRKAASSAATASYAIACANCGLPSRQLLKCVLTLQQVSRRKLLRQV